MTIATLGSIFIVLGIAVLVAGLSLPFVYGIRARSGARPSPRMRTLHRAPAARVERVSA